FPDQTGSAEHDCEQNEKRGFEYLNAIFFRRHRRLMIRPVMIRLGITGALLIAAIAASLLLPGFEKQMRGLQNNLLPVFVFVMYFASIGEKICKAMFYNCDVSLLRYPFYRNKNAVLHNFKIRLFWVAGLNFITACAVSAAVVCFFVITKIGLPVEGMAWFVLSILTLSLFFSVHHLFLYYVFQPFTSELGMKNPFYGIINYIVYMLCFFCLKIKSAPSYFTMIVLVSTVLYIIVALIIVYKFAPRTFRVK
ncbi:MAG TPA: hypothetical protein VHR42_04830, partial [Clostridia bacterium]|nr:hypothetical protein [Clostridia bacterium]